MRPIRATRETVARQFVDEEAGSPNHPDFVKQFAKAST